MRYSSTLLLLLVLWACLILARGQRTNITITVFISELSANTTELDDQDDVIFVSDLDGRQFQAAVDLAVEAINNHSQILDGYNLQVDYVDSHVGLFVKPVTLLNIIILVFMFDFTSRFTFLCTFCVPVCSHCSHCSYNTYMYHCVHTYQDTILN